jgi:glyoxylase-like metal-dependent hydrolase (beta-lactamase superfamily II)
VSRGSNQTVPWEIADGVFCLGPRGRTQSNVYLIRSGRAWTLVDAGWADDTTRIARAAAGLCGDQRPIAIVLTHCHPDHAGAARELARLWGCSVWVDAAELPIATGDVAAMTRDAAPLDRWIVLPLLRAMGHRRRERIIARSSLAEVVRPLAQHQAIPGLPEWQGIPTPGHTRGHTALFRPRDRVLITGDALVTLRVNSWAGLLWRRQGLSGPPWYTTWSPAQARASIETLAALAPAVIAGGHGWPRSDSRVADDLTEFAAGYVQH